MRRWCRCSPFRAKMRYNIVRQKTPEPVQDSENPPARGQKNAGPGSKHGNTLTAAFGHRTTLTPGGRPGRDGIKRIWSMSASVKSQSRPIFRPIGFPILARRLAKSFIPAGCRPVSAAVSLAVKSLGSVVESIGAPSRHAVQVAPHVYLTRALSARSCGRLASRDSVTGALVTPSVMA